MAFEKQIAVIIINPDEEPIVEYFFDNTLEAFQKAVGGYIEVVTVASDLALICNEEGRIKGLPFNRRLFGYDFYGPVLAVGVKGEDFGSIKAALIKDVVKYLGGGADVQV